jgi:hypothetical protein
MGTTAEKIARSITAQGRSGVIDLSGFRAARDIFREAQLDGDRIGHLTAQGYDLCHAVYVYGQNLTSVLAEQISVMKEARQYAKIVGDAEDTYIPAGPPISPLSTSYFTMWAFFDVLFGQSWETMGTCILCIAQETGLMAGFADVLELMQRSRMGFYLHCGMQGRHVRLREFGSPETKVCHVPTGYMGQSGEVWFVRVLPPINASLKYHVVFNTPYIIVDIPERMLADYLARELARVGSKRLPGRMDAHTFMMKHGPAANHWNEYIFLGYTGHQHDAVFLTGVPDIKETLPHA